MPLAAIYKTAATSMDKDYQSLHDLLTGLPNRALFRDRVSQAIQAGNRNGTVHAIKSSISISSRRSMTPSATTSATFSSERSARGYTPVPTRASGQLIVGGVEFGILSATCRLDGKEG